MQRLCTIVTVLGTLLSPLPVAPSAAAQAGGSARIAHIPENEVSSEGAELWFWVSHPDRLGEIVVYVRPAGGGDVTELVASRGERGWFVRLDPKRLPTEGIAYWVVERLPGGRRKPVFASRRDPHEVTVVEPTLAAYERRRLAEREGRRNRAILRGEYVGLGERVVRAPAGETRIDERYWRWEAAYEHAFFWAADSIRIRLGQLRGDVADLDVNDVGIENVGLDYGAADVSWRLADWLRVRTSVLFGFSQNGFAPGGGTGLTLGHPEKTSLRLGFDYVDDLGWTGALRLGWLVVPSVPMGATVEVTTFPADDEAGMRLLLDAAYAFYPGAYVKLTAGYRGWTSTTGGPSIGLEVALAF